MGRPKTYSVDDNYFKEINTKNKAYILGFLYADASINRKSNVLCITLSSKDVEILQFIKNELKYTGKIYEKVKNNRSYSILTITSKQIKNDLIELGVIPNKTYESTKLPIVSNELYSHMLRGLFDGDGSIWKIKNKSGWCEYCVNFSNNDSTLLEIKNYLIINGISSCKIRYRHGKEKINSCMLDIKGSVNIEKFYELLQFSNNFKLSRKSNKFDEFMEHNKNINRRYTKCIINEIKDMYIKGIRQFEIAKLLNLKKSSVRGAVQRLRRGGYVV